MAATPYTAATAVTAGFSKLTGTDSLFLHPRFPGFLFKLVTSTDQAITCGGILIRGTTEQVLYFGLDLVRVVKENRLGQYGAPGSFERVPTPGIGLGIVSEHIANAKWKEEACGSRLVQATEVWSGTDAAEGSYIGVISRADRGLLVDRSWKSGIAKRSISVPSTSPGAVQYDPAIHMTTENGYGVPTPAGSSTWLYSNVTNENVNCTFELAGITGYITNNIVVNKRGFLTAARNKFISEMDADSKIVAAYAAAYDELIAEIDVNATTVDPFTVYPCGGVDGATVTFTASKREMKSLYSGGSVYDDRCFFKYRKATLKPADNGVEAAAKALLRKELFMTVVYNHETCSQDAIPYPFWYPTLRNQGYMVAAEGMTNGEYAIPWPGEAHRLDAVPYKDVAFFESAKIPAAACYGPLGPRVRPDSNSSAELTLNLIGRINAEIGRKLGTVKSVQAPSFVGDTEQAVAAEAASNQLDAKFDDVKGVIKFMTGIAGFVTTFVNDLDIKAKAKLS